MKSQAGGLAASLALPWEGEGYQAFTSRRIYYMISYHTCQCKLLEGMLI